MGRDSCANAFITKMRFVVGLIPFFSKLLIASSLFMMLAPKKKCADVIKTSAHLVQKVLMM